jgi:putative transposase
MPKIKNHAPGEYYHLYNRGTQKQPIFISDSDRLRFLFLILAFQGEKLIQNISWQIKQSAHGLALNIKPELEKEILEKRTVELVSFCLMPNHFHLLVKEEIENGIPKYMQRVLTAYTMYFNKKYRKSGHLFQGAYKSVRVEDDKQLMHLSAYIHKNPSELQIWRNKEERYHWSSLMDYLSQNRFGGLLARNIILDRFEDDIGTSYREFIETSTAKE